MRIENGQGLSRFAGVTSDYELKVRGSMQENDARGALKGQCYFANIADQTDYLTVTSGVDTPIVYLRNNSSTNKILRISRYLLGALNFPIVFKIIKSPILGTISNHLTHIPPNTRVGSSNNAEVLCYTWNGTGSGLGGLTNGEKINTFLHQGGQIALPANDTFIIDPGSAMQWNVTPIGGNALVTLGIRFHMEELND